MKTSHKEIFQCLKREILAGRYEANGRFPTASELAERFGALPYLPRYPAISTTLSYHLYPPTMRIKSAVVGGCGHASRVTGFAAATFCHRGKSRIPANRDDKPDADRVTRPA